MPSTSPPWSSGSSVTWCVTAGWCRCPAVERQRGISTTTPLAGLGSDCHANHQPTAARRPAAYRGPGCTGQGGRVGAGGQAGYRGADQPPVLRFAIDSSGVEAVVDQRGVVPQGQGQVDSGADR